MNYLKLLQKCVDTHCGNVVSKKELESTNQEYIKDANKKCSKIKDVKKSLKCSLKVMKKSKFGKLLKKRGNCSKKHCKKEQENFRNSFKKFLNVKKNNKKSRKNSKKINSTKNS